MILLADYCSSVRRDVPEPNYQKTIENDIHPDLMYVTELK